MTISGAICALAGATQILGFTYSISVTSAMDNYGFVGLAVSLLASNNPIGVIFSGLFFGSLKYAGSNLQRVLGVPSELINIIIGTIILFTAVPLIFRIIRAKRRNRRLKNTGVKDIKEENFNEKASLTSTREEKDKNDLSANYGKEKKLLSNNESSSNIINETGEDITIRTIESEQE